jgi:hypothetical protein
LNNFEIVIFLQILEGFIETTDISVNLFAKELQPENSTNLSSNQGRIPKQDIFQKQPVTKPEIPASSLYNLQKYNQNQESKPNKPDKLDNKIAKQIRTILVLFK